MQIEKTCRSVTFSLRTNQESDATNTTCRLPRTVARPAPISLMLCVQKIRSRPNAAPESLAIRTERCRMRTGPRFLRRLSTTRTPRIGNANPHRNRAVALADALASRTTIADVEMHNAPATAPAVTRSNSTPKTASAGSLRRHSYLPKEGTATIAAKTRGHASPYHRNMEPSPYELRETPQARYKKSANSSTESATNPAPSV